MQVDDAWAFRTAADLSFVIRRDENEVRKLSRAALEVLAIIAYHQPVTRAEIEDIRGVQTSKGTLDVLMEAGWVRFRGRRRTPGRPVTLGTTRDFLDHFGLEELRDLPGLEELKGAGLLSGRIPANFNIPSPLMSDELDRGRGSDHAAGPRRTWSSGATAAPRKIEPKSAYCAFRRSGSDKAMVSIRQSRFCH